MNSFSHLAEGSAFEVNKLNFLLNGINYMQIVTLPNTAAMILRSSATRKVLAIFCLSVMDLSIKAPSSAAEH